MNLQSDLLRAYIFAFAASQFLIAGIVELSLHLVGAASISFSAALLFFVATLMHVRQAKAR
jgi:hypothetical protein